MLRDKKQLRPDLTETCTGGRRTEIRRAAREEDPEAGTGQEEDQGFGSVGGEGRHPVTTPYPIPPEGRLGAGHLTPELGETE